MDHEHHHTQARQPLPQRRRSTAQTHLADRNARTPPYRRFIQALVYILTPIVLTRIVFFAMIKVNLYPSPSTFRDCMDIFSFSVFPSTGQASSKQLQASPWQAEAPPTEFWENNLAEMPVEGRAAGHMAVDYDAPQPVVAAGSNSVTPPLTEMVRAAVAAAAAAAPGVQKFFTGRQNDGGAKALSAATAATTLFERIMFILVHDLGYKDEWIVTRVTGMSIFMLYSFMVTLLILFAALFHSFAFLYVVVRRWNKVWTFLRRSFNHNDIFRTGIL